MDEPDWDTIAEQEIESRRDEALGDYPEDWQEQGWCCRECAVMAWYAGDVP